jgi:hypothetical protein
MTSIENGDNSQLQALLNNTRQSKQVLQKAVLQEAQNHLLKQAANKEQPSKHLTAILSRPKQLPILQD